MRSFFYAQFVAIICIIFLAAGCGDGGAIHVPANYCNEDVDCGEGYTCQKKTSYDYPTCESALVQCSSEHDAGETVDAGVPDSGATLDAGELPDAGETVDGGGVTDAGVPDAGDKLDAGEVIDAGGIPDAGVPDSGTTLDAGALVDAGSPVDGGSNPVDAGTADAGVVQIVLAIDHEQQRNVTNDVVIFTWNTSRLATSELFIGADVVESDFAPKINHALVHKFVPGTYALRMVSKDGVDSTFVGGTVTVVAIPTPDLTRPVIVIGYASLTDVSVVINVLYKSEQLFDQTLSCGPDVDHLTVRPSGTVGSNTIPLSGLSPGTSYTCQLSGRDTAPAHNQGISEAITFKTTVPNVDLTPPFIVSHATQLSAELPVTLKWSSNKALSDGVMFEYWSGQGQHYRVEQQPGGMTGSTMIPAAGQPALTPLGSYSFTVTGTNALTGVQGVGQGTFTAFPFSSLNFGVVLTMPTTVHPSTAIDVNWWSSKAAKTIQMKCGTLPPVNVTAGLPATSGKVTLTGFNPVTTHSCYVAGTDQFDNASVPDASQRDLFGFTTWHVPTGKVVFACDPTVSGCTEVKVYWQSTDYSTNGTEIQLTVAQVVTGSLVNGNPQEKIQIGSNAPLGGLITQPGQAVRIYFPSGAPYLHNGSPVLPLTTDSNYRGRAVLNMNLEDRRALGYP